LISNCTARLRGEGCGSTRHDPVGVTPSINPPIKACDKVENPEYACCIVIIDLIPMKNGVSDFPIRNASVFPKARGGSLQRIIL